MSDTLFTRIIKGEIPCHKIYEDDHTFAFLDINPRQPGHTLVIPKNPVEFVWDLPDDDYDALMRTSRKLALLLRDVMNTKYVNESVVGTDIPHAHVHLIPFDRGEQLHGIHVELTDDEMAAIAAKIAI